MNWEQNLDTKTHIAVSANNHFILKKLNLLLKYIFTRVNSLCFAQAYIYFHTPKMHSKISPHTKRAYFKRTLKNTPFGFLGIELEC